MLRNASFCALALIGCLTGNTFAAGPLIAVTSGSNGHMTIASNGGQLNLNYYPEDCPADSIKSACYEIGGANGAAEPPPASAPGCVTSLPDVPVGSAICPAQGIKSITIVSQSSDGGTITVNQAQPDHPCSAVPVTVTRKRGIQSNIIITDGCQETVICTSGFAGDVEVDAKDVVKGCSYYMRDGQPIGHP
jgi:hypothetical protein